MQVSHVGDMHDNMPFHTGPLVNRGLCAAFGAIAINANADME